MFLGGIPQAAQRSEAKLKTIPLPLMGWNTQDAYSDMSTDYAVVMDNFFPDGNKLKTRGGYASYSTGMTGAVQTLMVYNPDSGSNKMFAANNGKIYEVTAGGAVGAAAVSGLTNNKWEYVNVGTSGGRFLFACNGQDTAQTFDGTTWANTTLTGPTTTALNWCNLHQRRLWVGQANSLSAWYGATNAITGAFTEFPLYGIANLGGYIMGMATWTRDAGDGQDDVAVFVTSEGQAIVYSGTDPSAAATWSLVGVFRIPKPIGRRFFIKAGGDVVLVTEEGFLSLSSALGIDRAQLERTAISDKINNTVNTVAKTAKGNFGWQPILYPLGKMLIFNVPIDGVRSHQYVFNAITKAACRFTGWNAECFAVLNDVLYFGGKDGVVYKADTGTLDNTSKIDCAVIPAFNDFGDQGRVKFSQLAKVIFEADGDVSFAFTVFKNYLVPDFIEAAPAPTGSSSLWDSALWDVALWGGTTLREYWRGVFGKGHALSVGLAVRPNDSDVSIIALKVTYKTGGILR